MFFDLLQQRVTSIRVPRCWAVFVLLGLYLAPQAPALGVTENPVDVRIYTESYPPYNYRTAEGEMDGLSTRIVRKVMDESGLSYQIHLVPWTRAYRAVLSQDDALIYTIARVPDREALFHWLVPLGTVRFHLYARADDNRFDAEIKIPDPRFHVACLVDDISCALVKDLGFPEDNIIRIAEMNRPDVMLVLAGRADLYVAEEIYNLYRLKRLGVDAGHARKVRQLDLEGNLYLAAAKGFRPEFKDAIQAAQQRLLARGENLEFDVGALSDLPD